MPNIPDGQYDTTHPWQKEPEPGVRRYDYLGPFNDRNEQLMGQALASNTVPGEYLADIVRPPLSQVALFRPKFGYRTRQLTIYDVMDVDEIYDEQGPHEQLEGGPAGFSGSSRNTLGNGTW
jgi:hypothetical protein